MHRWSLLFLVLLACGKSSDKPAKTDEPSSTTTKTDDKAAPADAPPADKTAPALDPKYKTDPKQEPKK